MRHDHDRERRLALDGLVRKLPKNGAFGLERHGDPAKSPPFEFELATLERVLDLIFLQAIWAWWRIASVMRRASSSMPRMTPDLRFESQGNPMK